MLKNLIKKYKRWKCRRDFSKLSKTWQTNFKFIGIDPESKIKRGEL